MYTQITGTHENKPTITVQFYNTGISLLYLEGTEPFARYGLTLMRHNELLPRQVILLKLK